MTKQEQIEEMDKMIKLIGNVKPFYVETIAKALYDAGYRKVLFDTENGKGVDCTQYVPWELAERHTKNEVEKTRKETARDIADWIVYRAKNGGYGQPIIDFAKGLAKIIKENYRVEVEQ